MKKLLGIGLALGLLAAGIGFYMFNKPVDKVGSMKTDFEIDATELLLAFEEDEDKANAKYLDKAIVISGKVTKAEEKDGITTIYLDADNPLSNIICQLEKNNGSSLKENQNVRIKGICSGYLSDVIIVRAIVLN